MKSRNDQTKRYQAAINDLQCQLAKQEWVEITGHLFCSVHSISHVFLTALVDAAIIQARGTVKREYKKTSSLSHLTPKVAVGLVSNYIKRSKSNIVDANKSNIGTLDGPGKVIRTDLGYIFDPDLLEDFVGLLHDSASNTFSVVNSVGASFEDMSDYLTRYIWQSGNMHLEGFIVKVMARIEMTPNVTVRPDLTKV